MCLCEWCTAAQAIASRVQSGLYTPEQVAHIHLLRRQVRAGAYADDLYSPTTRRLEFYSWLVQQGRLSDSLPVPPSRFEQLIAELRSRPVVPIDDLVAEERMRRMIPASDEHEERYP